MSETGEKGWHRAYATRAELLREKLTEEIISGTLAPGTRLDEQEIANRFGVSRTPVREAVRHLVATGLAESQPHLGATVSGLNTARLTAYLDAATELEVACVRLAALRMDRKEHAELLDLHARMGKNLFDDPERYEELNSQFHEMIYVGSHNEVMVEIIRNLKVRLAPVYRVQLTLAQMARQSYAEHERIVAAITAGDAVAAEVAMRAHMLSSALVLERLYGSALDAQRHNQRDAGQATGDAA
ncbi:MAG: GntR family transcriptional regulator [Rhizobiaceae bacterium]|nr:GntR family transcriptional regulator [Rhizobiaceae bacterium]